MQINYEKIIKDYENTDCEFTIYLKFIFINYYTTIIKYKYYKLLIEWILYHENEYLREKLFCKIII